MKLAKRSQQPLSPHQQLASEVASLLSQQLKEVQDNPEAFQERLRVLNSNLKDSEQGYRVSGSEALNEDQLGLLLQQNPLLLRVSQRNVARWLQQRPASRNQEQLEAWRQDGLYLWLSLLPRGRE